MTEIILTEIERSTEKTPKALPKMKQRRGNISFYLLILYNILSTPKMRNYTGSIKCTIFPKL